MPERIPVGDAATLTLVAEYPDLPEEEFTQLLGDIESSRARKIAEAIRARQGKKNRRSARDARADKSAAAIIASVGAGAGV